MLHASPPSAQPMGGVGLGGVWVVALIPPFHVLVERSHLAQQQVRVRACVRACVHASLAAAATRPLPSHARRGCATLPAVAVVLPAQGEAGSERASERGGGLAPTPARHLPSLGQQGRRGAGAAAAASPVRPPPTFCFCDAAPSLAWWVGGCEGRGGRLIHGSGNV